MKPKTQKIIVGRAGWPPFVRFRGLIVVLTLSCLSAIPSVAAVDVYILMRALEGTVPDVGGDAPYVEGTVAYVDERSIMHLEDIFTHGRYPHAEEYFIKELSLTIDPDALGVIVTGRRVRCGYSFAKEDYFVGRCFVSIKPSSSAPAIPDWPSIRNLAFKYKLGVLGCTDEEINWGKLSGTEKGWSEYCKRFDLVHLLK